MARIVIIIFALLAQVILWAAWVGMVREYTPETLMEAGKAFVADDPVANRLLRLAKQLEQLATPDREELRRCIKEGSA